MSAEEQTVAILRAVRLAGREGCKRADLDATGVHRERRNRILIGLSYQELVRGLRDRIYAMPPVEDEPAAIAAAARFAAHRGGSKR